MYKNQYLIAPRSVEINHLQLKSTRFDDYSIYSHSSLNVSVVKRGITQIALIGYAINPLSPRDSNDEIIGTLAEKCSTVNEFLKEVQPLSGRYVMLFKSDSSFITIGDACHLRQIFFGSQDDNFILTSSPKLFLDAFHLELEISKEKLEVMNTPFFIKEESAWYGMESVDNRLNKLLPNHYFDILTKVKIRFPFFSKTFANDEEIIEYASLILRNTFTVLTNRYNVIQPLTAGLDSRILLAASRAVTNKIQYYVFDMSDGKGPDVLVPTKLSLKLNLNFKSIKTEDLQNDFLEAYKKENLFPRILSKTAHIQHHCQCNYGTDVINVNGSCSEIARFVYGHSDTKTTLDMLLTFSKYHGKIPYFDEQLKKWYSETNQYAEDNDISLLDLFYWEQRIGNWHALWQFEQDIAVEEISPFNNRSLITSLIQASPHLRKSPDYSFSSKIIHHLWPEALSEPINPGGSYIRGLIRGNSFVRYFSRKIKLFFRL